MGNVDSYIEHVIRQGDEGSRLLAERAAPTLKNSELVDVLGDGMNGVAVLRVPEEHYVAGASIGGHPGITDPADYAASAVDRAVDAAELHGAEPIGFADVIDSATGDLDQLMVIQEALVKRANAHGLPILNGENAILGNRVSGVANITGTVVAMLPFADWHEKHSVMEDRRFAVFDPEGKPIYVCCDGIGTKGEFYERNGDPETGLIDSVVMKTDDAIKMGATIQAICEGVEISGKLDTMLFRMVSEHLRNQIQAPVALSFEDMSGRIRSYRPGVPATNFSGSAISTIDEDRLRNPLEPQAGDYFIAIRGEPNPRSNGISDRRRAMVRAFGPEWHTTDVGKAFMEYLASPSTLLYPVFKALVDAGLASSVFHLSGGSYDGKLARPLGKRGLRLDMEVQFPPDWRDCAMAGFLFSTAEDTYRKWPMGNDGFVSTAYPDQAMEVIARHGLASRYVGRLVQARQPGVTLLAANGTQLYFSGKD